MNGIEELRRLLDERGVEWWEEYGFTYWKNRFGYSCNCATGHESGMVSVLFDVKPEQAVEATLGRGMCEADETDTIKCCVKCRDKPSTEHMRLIHVMECSACGGTYEHVYGSYEFCPRCGRKVVDA